MILDKHISKKICEHIRPAGRREEIKNKRSAGRRPHLRATLQILWRPLVSDAARGGGAQESAPRKVEDATEEAVAGSVRQVAQ